VSVARDDLAAAGSLCLSAPGKCHGEAKKKALRHVLTSMRCLKSYWCTPAAVRWYQKIPSKFLVEKMEMGCTSPMTWRVTDTPLIRMRRRAAISRKSPFVGDESTRECVAQEPARTGAHVRPQLLQQRDG